MLRRQCNVAIQRPPLAFCTVNGKYNVGVSLFAIALLVVLTSSVTLSLYSFNAQAQEYSTTTKTTSDQKQIFRVNVVVINNAYQDEIGTIHVSIDGTDISKVLNGVLCPAKSTVYYTFEFDANDVPVGKGFTAEMVYGDDVFKKTHGVNSPSKTPEIVQITIP
jgi:hypothetical protein